MDGARLRQLKALEYRAPAPFLVRLRELEPTVAAAHLLTEKAKQLRTNSLKEMRELRTAALFCHGMSHRLGQQVFVGRGESSDYDFVASWVIDRTQHFAPVQLKEVVPTALSSTASLDSVLQGLTKYVDSADLTVVIHLNQRTSFDPASVKLPEVHLAGVWILGGISTDQSEWALWGNFLESDPYGTRFDYPAAA